MCKGFFQPNDKYSIFEMPYFRISLLNTRTDLRHLDEAFSPKEIWFLGFA